MKVYKCPLLICNVTLPQDYRIYIPIVISDENVNWKLCRNENGVFIRDDSSNGTFVDGVKIGKIIGIINIFMGVCARFEVIHENEYFICMVKS